MTVARAEISAGFNPIQRVRDAESAARQFEALMIQQLLKSMREAASGGDSTSGGETYLEMAEQQMAQVLAERGGFGIARVVLKNLKVAPDSADKATEGGL